jgi:hypothetical protein
MLWTFIFVLNLYFSGSCFGRHLPPIVASFASILSLLLFQAAASGTSTGIVRRIWAQHKMAELNSCPEKNKLALQELGSRFGIVTPSTSFLVAFATLYVQCLNATLLVLQVLETLEQHLKYNICPAPSRQDLFAAYTAFTQKARATDDERERKKVQKVIGPFRLS